MSSFEITGLEEFINRAEAMVDKFDDKKQILIEDMLNACNESILPKIPVDTSRLVSSFQIGTVTPDWGETGTNVEYALYVNDGHVQHKRFLPAIYLSAKGKRLYLKSQRGQKGESKGIMLKERYIPGVFFLEKGMKEAEPHLKSLGYSWLEEIAREIEGGGG